MSGTPLYTITGGPYLAPMSYSIRVQTSCARRKPGTRGSARVRRSQSFSETLLGQQETRSLLLLSSDRHICTPSKQACNSTCTRLWTSDSSHGTSGTACQTTSKIDHIAFCYLITLHKLLRNLSLHHSRPNPNKVNPDSFNHKGRKINTHSHLIVRTKPNQAT